MAKLLVDTSNMHGELTKLAAMGELKTFIKVALEACYANKSKTVTSDNGSVPMVEVAAAARALWKLGIEFDYSVSSLNLEPLIYLDCFV